MSNNELYLDPNSFDTFKVVPCKFKIGDKVKYVGKRNTSAEMLLSISQHDFYTITGIELEFKNKFKESHTFAYMLAFKEIKAKVASRQFELYDTKIEEIL